MLHDLPRHLVSVRLTCRRLRRALRLALPVFHALAELIVLPLQVILCVECRVTSLYARTAR